MLYSIHNSFSLAGINNEGIITYNILLKDQRLMSGVKGRSGRKPWDTYQEQRAIDDILKLSSLTIRRYLSDPDIAEDKKAQVATIFLSRRVSNKQENKTSIELTSIGRDILAKYNKPMELEQVETKLIDSV